MQAIRVETGILAFVTEERVRRLNQDKDVLLKRMWKFGSSESVIRTVFAAESSLPSLSGKVSTL